MTDKRIYQIGLTMINGVGDILARHLLQALGEAEAVFTEGALVSAAILLPKSNARKSCNGRKKSWLLSRKTIFPVII